MSDYDPLVVRWQDVNLALLEERFDRDRLRPALADLESLGWPSAIERGAAAAYAGFLREPAYGIEDPSRRAARESVDYWLQFITAYGFARELGFVSATPPEDLRSTWEAFLGFDPIEEYVRSAHLPICEQLTSRLSLGLTESWSPADLESLQVVAADVLELQQELLDDPQLVEFSNAIRREPSDQRGIRALVLALNDVPIDVGTELADHLKSEWELRLTLGSIRFAELVDEAVRLAGSAKRSLRERCTINTAELLAPWIASLDEARLRPYEQALNQLVAVHLIDASLPQRAKSAIQELKTGLYAPAGA